MADAVKTLRRLHRRFEPGISMWVDWYSGAWCGIGPGRTVTGPPSTERARLPLVALLDAALAAGARSVYLIGERPGDTLEGFHRWMTADVGDWQAGRHYLRDQLRPVLHFTHPYEGAQVDVRSAGEWFGDHARPDPQAIVDGWRHAAAAVAEQFDGGRLWASPQATGTDLLLRSLAEGREWATLDAELRRLLHRTSTQGRVETFVRPGPLPALVEYDGRFSYAALCNELPDGEPVTGAGWPDPLELGYLPSTEPAMVRGKFLVEFRPPVGWSHVGVLPWLSDGGWSWPTSRRWRQSWVDGAELWVAIRQRWEVKCRRHIAFRRPAGGGPLRAWADGLRTARSIVERQQPDGLGADMLRAVLLTTVGVLHGKGHTETVTVDARDPIPNGAKRNLRRNPDGSWSWEVDGGAARPEFAHPEWSSAIWSRCRARLLDGPGPGRTRTGALHVDPQTIVGFSVDAIYLTADPGWPDDGDAGRLRRKTHTTGPLPAPNTRAELLGLLREVRAA